MHLLTVSGITKQERTNRVLNDVSFTQQALQKIAIAGETGSGKSSLLKIIAGLVQPDNGQVWFENNKVEGPAEKLMPGHPGIAYLSQHFELLHNYRVEELLLFEMQLPDEEAFALFDLCRITHLMKRKTDQLSGGEKQRIALALLLVSSPRLLLLDEPFSNLDMIHKNILKSVIHDIGERLHITCILVSHDPLDTLSWADEIIVMRNGQIVQQGSPEQVYRQPVDEYTAGLFGKYNLLSGTQAKAFGLAQQDHAKKLFLRPEQLNIVSKESKAAIQAKVNQVNFLGDAYEIELLLPEQKLVAKTGKQELSKGDTLYVSLPSDGIWYI